MIKLEDFAEGVRNSHRGRFYCSSCRANLTRIVYETPTDGREHFRTCPRCGRRLRIDAVMKAVQMLAGTPSEQPLEREVSTAKAPQRPPQSPTVWLVVEMSELVIIGCYQDADRAELSCAGRSTEHIRILPLRLDEILDRTIDPSWQDCWEPGHRSPAQSATPRPAVVHIRDSSKAR